MAHHHTLKSGYHELVDRLNRFPQGAPPSDLLHAILQMLFSEEEAKLVSLLPIKPFTAEKAAKLWGIAEKKAEEILQNLAGRGILLDLEERGRQVYVLPPPMAGFFEFSLMRLRGDLDQKVLSELFYQYLNEEEDFIKALFTEGETQLGRVFIHEPVLSNDGALHVLDFERASHVIKTASHIGIGMCYCRHKMSHLGRACKAPMEICMTFNQAAFSLIRHGIARRVSVSECLGLLERAHENRLVQFGENVREGVNFICNCCGCCCEALIAARRFGFLKPVHTTNFIPVLEDRDCAGCGRCVAVCPVEAMALVSANDPHEHKRQKARLNEDICLGCGLCAAVCRTNHISMQARPERVITPVNSVHRLVLMAVERGKLQNFIFENQALLSHRAMAAILGVILRLPPVKRALAGRQLKSRYMEHLVLWYTKRYETSVRRERAAPESLLTGS